MNALPNVAPGEDLLATSRLNLQVWLGEAVPEHGRLVGVQRLAGGRSNPTYRVRTATADYALRRKPFGPLLPSAHAIEREYRLLKALGPTGFPAPSPIAFCDDAAIIGSSFYLMDWIDGVSHWDGCMPDVPRPSRRPLYESLVATLAQLHHVDWRALGLSDFGRPGNYCERQVARWIQQYRAVQTSRSATIERLIAALQGEAPPQLRTTIVHGDFRLDNVIYQPDGHAVAAVLDWELATLGDPLADFAYLAMNWVLPPDGQAGLAGEELSALNIPDLDEITHLYCDAVGIGAQPDLDWYFAYNMFRLISIIEGVKRRALEGNAASDDAERLAQRIPVLADRACFYAGRWASTAKAQ